VTYFKYDGALAALSSPAAGGLFGGSGIETLTGGAGADELWGGDGDRLVGGLGDDTYVLQGFGLQIVEAAGAGVDTIRGWQSVDLADHAEIENLRLANDGLYGAGNAKDNVILGEGGSQQLYGGRGQDVLVGGGGADVFVVYKGEGSDVIQDFSAGEDKVRLKAGFSDFSQVQARLSQQGADVKLDLGGGDGLIFRNLTVGQLSASNFQLELPSAAKAVQTFAEEFSARPSYWDATHAPTGVWRTDYGYQGENGVGSYTLVSNDEKQIYTSPYFRNHAGDFAESPFVSNGDGTLSIWARPSSNPELFGYGYTSGMLSTKPSFSQTYGYFEMRADLPEGAGTWPAFWLLPVDGSWPPELDVMETLGDKPNAAWTTRHSGVGGHTSQGQSNYIPETGDGMHTYGALWNAQEIVWYVDNVEVFRASTPSDMNKPMYMIANLALGGWAGTIAGSALPAEMQIDYIRAYGLAPEPVAPSPAPSSPPASSPPTGGASSGGGGVAVVQLAGGAGGDALNGTAGADSLAGHGGPDTLMGGGGNDTLSSGDGESYLRGEAGGDVIYGGAAFDNTHGNMGSDTIYGGDGGDWVVGGQEADVLNGDGGADQVHGNLGADSCYGGDGADYMRGGQAEDLLVGGAGDDWMAGDRGADTLVGGTGADTFYSFGDAGVERITDFNRAEGDQILLEAGTTYAMRQAGSDLVLDLGGGGQVIMMGVSQASLGEGWLGFL
jgi:serralysin